MSYNLITSSTSHEVQKVVKWEKRFRIVAEERPKNV